MPFCAQPPHNNPHLLSGLSPALTPPPYLLLARRRRRRLGARGISRTRVHVERDKFKECHDKTALRTPE
jgi:hypothetical protein